jgi:AraC family transcriptional regulator
VSLGVLDDNQKPRACTVNSRRNTTLAVWEGLLPSRIMCSVEEMVGGPVTIRQSQLAMNGCIELPPMSEHAIMLLMRHPTHVGRWFNGRYAQGICAPRAGALLPAGKAAAFHWAGTPIVMLVSVNAAWVDDILRSELELDPARVDIVERSRWYDPFLWTFGAGLLHRARLGLSIDRLLLDSAALGLICHLLRCNSTPTEDPTPRSRMLSPSQLLQVSDFIDDKMASDFGLDDLARATSARRVDLARSFASANGLRLHEYIAGRRIERARALLSNSRMAPDEIAQAVGFKDLAALDIALYFAVGCSAAEYRGHFQ